MSLQCRFLSLLQKAINSYAKTASYSVCYSSQNIKSWLEFESRHTYLHIEYLLYIWGKHWTYLHLLCFFLRTLASSLLTTLFFFHPAWTLTLKVILLEYRNNLRRKKDNEMDRRVYLYSSYSVWNKIHWKCIKHKIEEDEQISFRSLHK